MAEERQYQQFPDGSAVGEAVGVPGKWQGRWCDGTPMRGENDQTSYFPTKEEAIQALVAGGEGPRPLASKEGEIAEHQVGLLEETTRHLVACSAWLASDNEEAAQEMLRRTYDLGPEDDIDKAIPDRGSKDGWRKGFATLLRKSLKILEDADHAR